MSELESRDKRVRLSKLIANHFNLEELKALCYSLDIDIDELPANTKTNTAIEIVEYAIRHGNLIDLVKACKELRPNVLWLTEPSESTPETAKISLSTQILQSLYEQRLNEVNPSSHLSFSNLCDENNIMLSELRRQLFSLQKQGLVQYEAFTDSSDGQVKITPLGREAVKEILLTRTKKRKSDRSTVVCPESLEELAEKSGDFKNIFHRADLLIQVKNHFHQKAPRPLVISGERMVGKTRLLTFLPQVLGDQYISLMITGQGFNTAEELDSFIYDFAVQLTEKFNDTQPKSLLLDTPDRQNFTGNKARRIFYTHWRKIKEAANNKKLVIMFDEIERLLDFGGGLNPEIFRFLEDFIRNPQNAYFVLAGSEKIRRIENEQFRNIVIIGEEIPIKHYKEETVRSIFSLLEEYFICEESALDILLMLCDGHPRFVHTLLEAIFIHVRSSPDKRAIRSHDVQQIVESVLERTNTYLWTIGKRLTDKEILIMWLVRLTLQDFVYEKSIFTVSELQSLLPAASHYFPHTEINKIVLERGIADLRIREWIDAPTVEQFRLKLGFFPYWLYYNMINPSELINQ